jgi:hypothetical protein
MTIWLLGLVLLGSLAGVGYRQGGIRAGSSFIGLLFGAALAVPVGKLMKLVLIPLGVKNPVLLWLLGPFLAFCVILAIFKVAAFQVHRQADVYYKYRAGDLRLALWERLNARLGLCVGLLNGAVYLALISFVIYLFSYWTVQTATSEKESRWIRLLNRAGWDLEKTGMIRVARSLDRVDRTYYDMADFAGMLYHNSLAEARMARYPGFLSLAERPDFQDLANDKEFTEMWQKGEPAAALLNYPKVKTMLGDMELMKRVWSTVSENLDDLRIFLNTGRSPRFDPEEIVGRWEFDVNGSLRLVRAAKPNLMPSEMRKWKVWLANAFEKTSFVATPEGQAILKNAPQLGVPGAGGAGASGPQTVQGRWKKTDTKYLLSLRNAEMMASVEGEKLTMSGEGVGLAFVREH